MTSTSTAVSPEIGKARARKEDARLVTGQTNWTDNIQLPGLVQVAYLRSPMAHARITSVDVSAARGAPGVIAAFSGADFAAEQGSLACAWPVTPDIVIPAHPPMATDEVRYVGEIVATLTLEASSTALTMLWYPVHRQRLPSRPLRTSSSVGLGLSARRPAAAMIMPGVQYPHCRPWSFQNAS